MCYITTTDSPSVGTQHFAVSTLPYYGPRHFRTIRRVTTGDIIRQKAQLLWRQLPQTRGSLGQSLANTGLRVTRRDIRSDYNKLWRRRFCTRICWRRDESSTNLSRENVAIEPDYSIQDAKHALKVLLSFTEKQSTMSTSYFRTLERYEQELTSIERNSLVQGSLDKWLM